MFNVIVNPTKKKARKAIIKIAKFFKKNGTPFSVYYSETKGQVCTIAEKLHKEGQTDFIILGGDGTLHEFINGIDDLSNVNMGIIPCGTGNDFCKALNLPKKVSKAIDVISAGKTEAVDYIVCNDKKAINTASMGLDCDVIKKFNQCKRKGKISYLGAALRVVSKVDGYTFSFKSAEKEFSNKRLLMIACCNGEYFGNGMHVSPLSNLEDGLINVIQIDYISQKKRLPMLFSFVKGKHIYNDYTKQTWTDNIEITGEADKMVTINLDGELYDFDKINLSCKKSGLNIYVDKNKDI